MIPTTDEMDQITAAERNKLIGQCGKCGEWHPHSRDNPSKCPCGGELMSKTIRSQRTFNEEQAKKETASFKRKMRAS